MQAAEFPLAFIAKETVAASVYDYVVDYFKLTEVKSDLAKDMKVAPAQPAVSTQSLMINALGYTLNEMILANFLNAIGLNKVVDWINNMVPSLLPYTNVVKKTMENTVTFTILDVVLAHKRAGDTMFATGIKQLAVGLTVQTFSQGGILAV